MDLNNAWITKCKNVRVNAFIEIANIIMAICLRVDRAIIFFISCSQLAAMLEYKAVIVDNNISIINIKLWGCEVIRNKINTPAVTKVDECTKAEIGVGAAIAIGNHAEKGNCALFEEAANINKIKGIVGISQFIEKLQDFIINNILIEIKIKISPIRFLNKVIDPEALER